LKRCAETGLIVFALLALGACGGSNSGGGGNPVAPTITTQPANQAVVVGQTAMFSVTATGTAPLSYQWIDAATGANITGATSSSYTTPATTLGDNGSTFRVDVINAAGSTLSQAATLTVTSAPPPSNIRVLTYHNDNSRTGQNLQETILTTTNVASAQFGILGTIAVDGPVDAEPLYVGGMTINGATHNVLFVVTESDSVYAFDADTFTQLWHNAVLTGTGESVPTAGAANSDIPCGQVQPTIGITSTPVIDLGAGPNGTIFVVAMSKSGSTYHQRLHALDLTTGNDRMTAANITATGFDPKQYEERTGLLLSNGVIYLAWTSHCDGGPYNAWVMGYAESNLQQTSMINLTPSGSGGGIWMSGDGLAADSSNNIYFLDGNGTFDTTLNNGFPINSDYGNGFIKLSTTGNTLAVADYFEMSDTVSQSNSDRDLGSGGVLLLPDMKDSTNTTRHLAVGAGKADVNSGNVVIYVVDRDSMGKFNPNNNSAIYQEIGGGLLGGQNNGVWAAPAYFNNTLYYGAVNDTLKAFAITQAKVATSASSHSVDSFGYPGTTPSISANGSTNGVVWAIQSSDTLLAYDATNLGNKFFSGSFPATGSTKFITPMIANGKVYVGTGAASGHPGTVVVFGLPNQGAGLIRAPRPARDRRRWLPQPKPPHPNSSTPGL